MRTTLTLEEDVAARLRAEMRSRGGGFKETVNELLRRGLDAPRPESLARPFRIEAEDLGLRPGVDLDDVGGLLEILEGASHS